MRSTCIHGLYDLAPWAERITQLYLQDDSTTYRLTLFDFARALVRTPRQHDEFEQYIAQLEADPSMLAQLIADNT